MMPCLLLLPCHAVCCCFDADTVILLPLFHASSATVAGVSAAMVMPLFHCCYVMLTYACRDAPLTPLRHECADAAITRATLTPLMLDARHSRYFAQPLHSFMIYLCFLLF